MGFIMRNGSVYGGSSGYLNEIQPYDSTKTYEAGEHVIYNGAVMECSSTIYTAEAWNAAHWNAAPIDRTHIVAYDILEDVNTKGY